MHLEDKFWPDQGAVKRLACFPHSAINFIRVNHSCLLRLQDDTVGRLSCSATARVHLLQGVQREEVSHVSPSTMVRCRGTSPFSSPAPCLGGEGQRSISVATCPATCMGVSRAWPYPPEPPSPHAARIGVFTARSGDAQPRASRTLSITVEPCGTSHPESFLKETPNFQHLLKALQAAALPADVSSC